MQKMLTVTPLLSLKDKCAIIVTLLFREVSQYKRVSAMNRFEIQRYIEQQCHPVSVSDLIMAHPDLIRRTLQRWLNKLIEDNQIAAIGDGRSRKYNCTD